jgi:AAA family ATP:ADP antiporter
MSATFILMLIVTPIYGGLARRVARKTLFLITYLVFITLFGWFAWSLPADLARLKESPTFIGVFYIWASFFSLFSVSCFWSFLVDVFSTAEAKSSFGSITASGTAGSILASLVAINLSNRLGHSGLLAITAVSLGICAVMAVVLDRQSRDLPPTTQPSSPEISWRDFFIAFRSLATSPYLIAIAMFLFVGTAIDIVLYYDVNGLMKSIPDVQQRTSLFAKFNLYSSLAIALTQGLLTAWFLRHGGVSAVLIGVPLVYALSFAVLGSVNSITVAFAVGILIRVLWLSLVAPSREILFTRVPREDKYATKNLIDTVFVRGGGVLPGFIIEPAKLWTGSIERVLWGTIPFALLAAGLGAYLGRLHRQSIANDNHSTQGTSSP